MVQGEHPHHNYSSLKFFRNARAAIAFSSAFFANLSNANTLLPPPNAIISDIHSIGKPKQELYYVHGFMVADRLDCHCPPQAKCKCALPHIVISEKKRLLKNDTPLTTTEMTVYTNKKLENGETLNVEYLVSNPKIAILKIQ